jgi:hypothetical protein
VIHAIVVEGMLRADPSFDRYLNPELCASGVRRPSVVVESEYTVKSPVFGVPVAINLLKKPGWSPEVLFAHIDLPIHLALYGPAARVHGWSEALDLEKLLASWLVRASLHEAGFQADESKRFIRSARTESVTLAWRTTYGTRSAAMDLLRAAHSHARDLRDRTPQPRVCITGCTYLDRRSECSLVVSLSDGGGLRLSAEQRHDGAAEGAVDQWCLTVETTVGRGPIASSGIDNPGSWSRFSMEACAAFVLRQAANITETGGRRLHFLNRCQGIEAPGPNDEVVEALSAKASRTTPETIASLRIDPQKLQVSEAA